MFPYIHVIYYDEFHPTATFYPLSFFIKINGFHYSIFIVHMKHFDHISCLSPIFASPLFPSLKWSPCFKMVSIFFFLFYG
jgi:hypothetical protein